MKTRWNRFNIYLAALCLLIVGTGCQSPEKRVISVLRIHLETNRDGSERTRRVPVYRDKPIMISVDSKPFLTEGLLAQARVVDSMGGFSLQLEFERRGTWLLEQYTAANRGKRIAVYGEFKKDPKDKTSVTRWLGAPMVTQKIPDGKLVFTADASREELLAYVQGLNNVARKLDNSFKW